MRRAIKGPMLEARRRILEMLLLHSSALHLSRVKKYHASREKHSKKSRNRGNTIDSLTLKWAFPVYLLDMSASRIDLNRARKNGRVQVFLVNGVMPAVSEAREDSRISSVVTGAAAAAQYRILRRLLSNKSPQKFEVLSVPVLHFRGITYVREKDAVRIVVPLRSPIAQLSPGKPYRGEFVLRKLHSAVADRISASKRFLRT